MEMQQLSRLSTFYKPLEKIFSLLMVVMLCLIQNANAQRTIDSSSIHYSSTDVAADDSLKLDDNNDSLKAKPVEEDKETAWGVRFSKDGLSAEVSNTADDSAVLDLGNKVFYLYGNATANYQDIKVKSGMMVYSSETSILDALPIKDTNDKIISGQEFVQGEEQFTYDTLRYNFKSKRALVRNARSQYGEGFVLSKQVKRNADESIYGWKNVYTTCDLPHPHFGIRANKIKVIPGQLIASGPANLEIQDIPTPLFLPFGIFPLKKGQRSGFILPSYTMEDRKGVGLQQAGYYFAVSDRLGITNRFNIFSKGSWAYFGTVQYASRYHYSGSFDLNYSFTKFGESFETNSSISKDFQVNWSHTVDPKARPGSNFSASVNLGTSSYNQMNGMENYNDILNNQYSSSVNYSKSWIGKPYSLSVALRHSQSTLSHQVTVGLPEINFNLGQFSPFQRKQMIGQPKWYEKISITYSASAKNNWNFIDSNFNINNLRFKDFDNGILQSAAISASYKIMRYFTLNFNAPYREYWNTKQAYFLYDIQTQRTDTSINEGFFATRDFNMSTTLSTRVYGMKMFKNGRVRGIRHVMTPSMSATYTPGFAHKPFGYMYETVDQFGNSNYSSPYRLSPIGGPSNPNNSGAINFSLANTLQMKVRNKMAGDSTGESSTKNISLIDGLGISGNYDLFADSFNMSMINLNFRTSLMNKVNLSASATFDPYVYKDGIKTKDYLITNGGTPVVLRSANLAFNFNIQGKRNDDGKVDSARNNNEEVALLLDGFGINDYYDFNIPWNLSVNGGINFNRRLRRGLSDTLIFSPNLTFSGGFNLTERWQLNFNSGLQFTGFKKIEMGLTNINVSRDMHCWQMSLNLVPFGVYRSFNFMLRVKASVLQDLKLVKRRSYQDNY